MLTFPNIDPVAIAIGPVKVHWYGLMYLVGFVAVWWLGNYRAKQEGSGWKSEHISDLLFYGALGVILGGRIGYTFFYAFEKFIDDPLMIFRVWEGGMSFHGGFIGVLVAMALFARKTNKRFFHVMDFLAPLAPIGLGAGRIGNFINAELWGRTTDVPWGMIFPNGGDQPRHPSQLYEFFLEGVLLFVILWIYSSKPRPFMAVSGLFSLCYGSFRFIVEFFRQPDDHLNFIAFDWLTMGQLLSTPMIILGAVLLWLGYSGRFTSTEANNNNTVAQHPSPEPVSTQSGKSKKNKRRR